MSVPFQFPSFRPTFARKFFHLTTSTVLLVRLFLVAFVSYALFRFTLVAFPILPLFKGSYQGGSSCVRFQLQSSSGFDIFCFYLLCFLCIATKSALLQIVFTPDRFTLWVRDQQNFVQL